MKAVFLDFATLGDSPDPAALYELLPDLELHAHTPPDAVAERIRDAEIVFLNKVVLDRDAMRSAGNLRYVGVVATGTDNVDRDWAAEHGIAVTNIRAYCTQSVTEHVFGSVLMLTHNLHRYRAEVARGRWQEAKTFCLLDHPIRELSSMTLGIVGYGELGSAVARVAKQFGMTVLVSRRIGDDGDQVAGRVDFPLLLREADVLSLHCPLNDDTAGLIGAAELDAMRSTAILVNTARGGLVDSRALVAALKNGDIAAAAIDVLTDEPPASGDPLLDYRGDNLLLTPHIAWATDRARQNALQELAANLREWQEGSRRNRIV
ncbi:MAG: D-2-hydroxyacid dehydrogenase [Woeseiaceae bacterium]|nr:D-2-hydroxyacid dehydrogenase [Woeseiaceae bacterium]